MTKGIEGKVVVITGASSWLGEATARRLAQDGKGPVGVDQVGEGVEAITHDCHRR